LQEKFGAVFFGPPCILMPLLHVAALKPIHVRKTINQSIN